MTKLVFSTLKNVFYLRDTHLCASDFFIEEFPMCEFTKAVFSTLETIFYQKNIWMFLSIWPSIYYIIHVFSKEIFLSILPSIYCLIHFFSKETFLSILPSIFCLIHIFSKEMFLSIWPSIYCLIHFFLKGDGFWLLEAFEWSTWIAWMTICFLAMTSPLSFMTICFYSRYLLWVLLII